MTGGERWEPRVGRKGAGGEGSRGKGKRGGKRVMEGEGRVLRQNVASHNVCVTKRNCY